MAKCEKELPSPRRKKERGKVPTYWYFILAVWNVSRCATAVYFTISLLCKWLRLKLYALAGWTIPVAVDRKGDPDPLLYDKFLGYPDYLLLNPMKCGLILLDALMLNPFLYDMVSELVHTKYLKPSLNDFLFRRVIRDLYDALSLQGCGAVIYDELLAELRRRARSEMNSYRMPSRIGQTITRPNLWTHPDNLISWLSVKARGDLDGFSLHAATEAGDVKTVKNLKAKGCSLEGFDTLRRKVVDIAVLAGSYEMASELIALGADIDNQDVLGLSPLAVACMKGRTDLVRLLLENGARRDPTDFICGGTPLMISAAMGNSDCVELLIRANANIATCDKKRGNAIGLAVSNNNVDVVRQLLRAGSDVNCSGYAENTLLMYAAAGGDAEMLLELLRAGADINARNKQGRTALMYAAKNCSVECVTQLTENGANAAIMDKEGLSAADLAVDVRTRAAILR